jgi:hypothetical protein
VPRPSYLRMRLISGALIDDRGVLARIGDALVHRLAEVDAVGESTSSTAPFVHGLSPRILSAPAPRFAISPAVFSSRAMVTAEPVLASGRSSLPAQLRAELLVKGIDYDRVGYRAARNFGIQWPMAHGEDSAIEEMEAAKKETEALLAKGILTSANIPEALVEIWRI